MKKRILATRALAGTFRLVGSLLEHWPLALLVLFFLSDTGPHIRWEYTYRGSRDHPVSCTYLGAQGFIKPLDGGECPFIAIINSNEGERL